MAAITVVTLTGGTTEVVVDLSGSVAELKAKIQDMEGIPPLASDVQGMMEADPGRMDPVDDEQPTHDCDVSQRWRSWVQGHAETCQECRRAVEAKGLDELMPGDLPTWCPCNFRLIAHRLRVGITPHMQYEPEQYVEANRESVGEHFAGACKHLDQVEEVGHVFPPQGEWHLPEGASAWAL